MFVADNTKVEWSVTFANVEGEKKYGIATWGFDDVTTNSFKKNEIITNIHSHPKQNTVKDEQESMLMDRTNSLKREL